jgi:hypothetical protein
MSIIGSNILAGASGQAGGAGAYEIERSVRFSSSDSAYLSRTPASAGNRRTYTLSFWTKRAALASSGYQAIFSAGTGGGANSGLYFSSDKLEFFHDAGNSGSVFTAAVLRDVSAWYHVALAVDTTQSTAANRVKFYINGIDQALTGTQPTQNLDSLYINQANAHNIGRRTNGDLYLNAYLADIHFIDSQALTPSAFGEFDTNGVWQPIEYAGSYGTNGFHLPFSNNSTAAALGTDTSSNGNTWTVNNISVTAGVGNDSVVDSPTNGSQVDTGVGGEVVGNYATLNPLASASGVTLSNGNLEEAMDATYRTNSGTIYVSSGKWYAEMTAGTQSQVGIVRAGAFDPTTRFGEGANQSGGYAYNYYDGYKLNNGSGSSYGATYSTGDIIGVAMDLDAGTLTFYKNNTSQGVAFSGLPAGNYTFGSGHATSTGTHWNFGQRPFAYTAPSGFKALCTTNLPEPTIADGSQYFQVIKYPGNGTTQTLPNINSEPSSGLNFSPDFVWIKNRSEGFSNILTDTVRGAGNKLISDRTDAENTTDADPQYGTLEAFTSNGFTVNVGTFAPTAGGQLNKTSIPYAAWTWDAGSSTVTNTQGSITSQVRANASAGFSVVTYTGTGSQATIGHGLNVAPGLIIAKRRDSTSNWDVYHSSLGKDNTIFLNSTSAVIADANHWGTSTPNSTVFGAIGAGAANNAASGSLQVAYCFAPVAGYSSFGSYVGNGSSTNGPFVYLGFRPKFILFKSSTSGENWDIYDSSRSQYNLSTLSLQPNLSGAEYNAGSIGIDFLSNGFKLIGGSNTSSQTYIYAAFAEHPFATSRAR